MSDTDTSFIVKAADPYTRKELGVVGDEPILHFNTVFDDVMDDVHCTLFCTLHIHEHKIHDIHTECWVTSIKPISHCLTVAHQYRVYEASISSLCFKSVKSKQCNFPVSINTWVFKYRSKRGLNILVNKLLQVFMSYFSINKTYKQEVNFVSRKNLCYIFRLEVFVYSKNRLCQLSRSLIRVFLNFFIVISLR